LDDFLVRFSEVLLESGPAVSFLFAFLETVWVTGLVMPTGPVIIFSTALATDAGMPVVPIFLSALAGGALGDATHYWIGRRWGESIHRAPGRLGRAVTRHARRARVIFDRHPAFAVTGARLVSFVRTLMPGMAGFSGLRYRTFLPFDLLGLGLWACLYVGIGMMAGESWRRVSSVVGSGMLLLFGVVAWVLWRGVRASARSRRSSESPDPPQPE
jgi:membrane protein DedA with SNARE-associated domain